MAYDPQTYPLIERIVYSFDPLVSFPKGERPHRNSMWYTKPVPANGGAAATELLDVIKTKNDGGYHNLDMLWNVFWQLEQFYCLDSYGSSIIRCPWDEAKPYQPPVQALIDLLDYLGNEIERIKYSSRYSSYEQSCYEFLTGKFR